MTTRENKRIPAAWGTGSDVVDACTEYAVMCVDLDGEYLYILSEIYETFDEAANVAARYSDSPFWSHTIRFVGERVVPGFQAAAVPD